jgi:TPP-dependent 2-oxoacid decarboxylase
VPATPTIGEYLLDKLYAAGVAHVFGVPGDYVLKFYDQIVKSPIQHVGTTREDTAAFAADGYARCRGLGALAVTYGVGALNVVNAVAGAHAESSPVVVISGAPGVREQREDPLIHHRFGPFTFQREIFDRITCATAVLDDPAIAFRQIDRVLAAAQRNRRPVYIELPRDVAELTGYPMPDEAPPAASSDPAALEEAVAETMSLLDCAKSPVLLAGVELHRGGLQDTLVQLVERLRLPIAATLTGKSVIGERHPAYLGVYEGAMGPDAARERVEAADLLLLLGVALNDVDLGVYTARLDPKLMVRANQGEVVIRHHRYPGVQLRDFVPLLIKKGGPQGRPLPTGIPGPAAPGFPKAGEPMKIGRLIGRLNQGLTPDMVVVCDVGDCLFAAVELRVHERTEFLASAYYTTMGFGVPAALGAAVARPDRRPLVLVGDGAFQMTGTELSTLARIGSNAIVVVFNNAGYSTERFILDGPFNDVAPWRFHRIGELFGEIAGYETATEDAFEEAFASALEIRDRPSLIEVRLSPSDPSPAMKRLAQNLRAKVEGRTS